MRKIYLDLPTLKTLEKSLLKTFVVTSNLTDGEIIITEGDLEFVSNRFIILIADEPNDSSHILIQKSLPTESILQAIKAAVDTYILLSGRVSPNKSIHVLKDSNPKVGYLVKKLENILNAANECIVEVDFDGTILFHNKKFAETYDNPNAIIDGSIYAVLDAETGLAVNRIKESLKDNKAVDFSGKMTTRSGATLPIEGHIAPVPGDSLNYEMIFADVTEKLKRRMEAKKSEEQAIVAGFSRHLSHNVMNSLTAAGGFIRQIRSKTDTTLHLQNLWHIIDEKLLFIEEIVAGYNDYTHAVTLRKTERVDIAGFYKELITDLGNKKIDKNFSAFLYKFTDNYELTGNFAKCTPFQAVGNKLFLKLALCYILKDNIRYFSGNLPLKYDIVAETSEKDFKIEITVLNVDVPEQIIDTMFKPWNHQILTQSFDYWGIMIANTIIANHGGILVAERAGGCLKLVITFNKN